jgi:UDP-GlcNAc:undecaprenyl-phosphate GlcNAc-1-phosphate transferase
VIGAYGVVFAVAAVGTWLCTFAVRKMAVRVGAVVMPDERRVHAAPTPTAGGVAMFVAFLLAMLAAARMGAFEEMFQGSSAPLGVVIGASIIFAVGLADDLRDMSAPAKLAGQVLAGSSLALLGVTMFFLQVPFAGFIALSPDLEPLATVLWVAIMANAVNLIDGLDGLAAGIVALAAGSFFVYGDNLMRDGNLGPENVGPLLAVIVCGICVGFLPHNFHPARIFMGDAGAMLLGLLMAGSTLIVVGQTDNEFSGKTFFFFAPVFIPFFILGVPILDTIFAIIRRAGRRGVAEADKEHLHHRLMRLGHGHRRSVVILWAWTAVLCGLVLYPTFTNQGNAIIPVLVAGLGIALYTLFHPGIRQRPVVGEPPEGLADVVPLDDRKTS